MEAELLMTMTGLSYIASCLWKLNFSSYPHRRHIAASFFRAGVTFVPLAPVVQKLDNAIHRINHYPVDSVVCFVNTYPLDSDLSGG